MRILGIDPGFANMGYAIATYTSDSLVQRLVVREMGVIRTTKSTRMITASRDNARRTKMLFERLRELAENCDCICMESMSFPRSASTAGKLSAGSAAVACVASLYALPIEENLPTDIKLAVTGSKKASKSKMAEELLAIFPECIAHLEGIPASRQEHPLDALGAIVAALDSDVVKAGLR